MTCPECDLPMAAGYIELHSPLADALFSRSARVKLTFYASSTFEYDLIEPSQRSLAFECDGCGTMVLTTQPWLA